MVLLKEGTFNLFPEPVTSSGDSPAVARPSPRGTRRLFPPSRHTHFFPPQLLGNPLEMLALEGRLPGKRQPAPPAQPVPFEEATPSQLPPAAFML